MAAPRDLELLMLPLGTIDSRPASGPKHHSSPVTRVWPVMLTQGEIKK